MNTPRSPLSWLAAAALLLSATLTVAAPVDVNTASADELAAALDGIGAAKAARIVAHRDQHGPFKTAADLAEVSGIGEKILERIKPDLRFGSR